MSCERGDPQRYTQHCTVRYPDQQLPTCKGSRRRDGATRTLMTPRHDKPKPSAPRQSAQRSGSWRSVAGYLPSSARQFCGGLVGRRRWRKESAKCLYAPRAFLSFLSWPQHRPRGTISGMMVTHVTAVVEALELEADPNREVDIQMKSCTTTKSLSSEEREKQKRIKSHEEYMHKISSSLSLEPSRASCSCAVPQPPCCWRWRRVRRWRTGERALKEAQRIIRDGQLLKDPAYTVGNNIQHHATLGSCQHILYCTTVSGIVGGWPSVTPSRRNNSPHLPAPSPVRIWQVWSPGLGDAVEGCCLEG